MSRNRFMLVLGLLIVVSMILAACAPATEAPTTPVVPGPGEVTEAPTEVVPMTTRHGGWLDEIDKSVVAADQAVTQLSAGTIDVYAYGIPDLASIQAANLQYAQSVGGYYTIMYNPAVCTDTTVLNPFSDRKIRAATNMLIDRNYINQEVYFGGSLPKWFIFMTNGPDYADLAETTAALEAQYAYNFDLGKQIISDEMVGLGAELVDGKWMFNGAPVTLEFLIRNDGDLTRIAIGDYMSTQFEDVGFTVTRDYKKSSEAGPIWYGTQASDCMWNAYTAGWISTGLSRDSKDDFFYMFLPDSGYGIDPMLSNVPDPEFQQVGDDLANGNFTTPAQRHDLMARATELSLEDSLQIGVVDQAAFAPYSQDVQVTGDLAGGIASNRIAWYTVRFKGEEGGTLKWADSDLFTQPWNPIGGSNWVWDQGVYSATSSDGYMYDPFTGLIWPLRAETAEVTAKKGLPINSTLDWVTLDFADTINVPADAWANWDAVTQTFIPAGEGVTANIKSVVHYPADLWDTVTWHDGNPVSMGDFIMDMIMTFDPGKPDSAIYDAAAAPAIESFLTAFKGVKITSTDPLVIETYTDNYVSDAELDVFFWWPFYAYGEGRWDVIAMMNMAEATGELAYTSDKSEELGVEETSLIGGPSLDILSAKLDEAAAENLIPYEATLGAYVTADEAAARYAGLQAWYADHGHFWVGTGPYFLDQVFLVEKSCVLKNYADYPDLADRWDRFATPMIAVVDITAPAGSVTIGDAATFDVAVTFEGEPYPSDTITSVKYLLFDATNAIVQTGDAEFVSEGNYTVTLTGADTGALAAGSNKLTLIVVSKAIAIPTFTSVEFVTAP
jgi:peptide/nickel transport system substrate-binding protein